MVCLNPVIFFNTKTARFQLSFLNELSYKNELGPILKIFFSSFRISYSFYNFIHFNPSYDDQKRHCPFEKQQNLQIYISNQFFPLNRNFALGLICHWVIDDPKGSQYTPIQLPYLVTQCSLCRCIVSPCNGDDHDFQARFVKLVRTRLLTSRLMDGQRLQTHL